MKSGLTVEQMRALLERLSTDDDYRELFRRDLAAALKQLPGSPDVPEGLEPGCCLLPAQLASKQTLAEAREQLLEDWQKRGSHIPHILEEERKR